MTQQEEGRFMVAVGAVIEDEETGKILLVKRSKNADFQPGQWESIYGRMKQFEDLPNALQREIHEEAGIDIELVTILNAFHIFRGEKSAENDLIGIVFWAKAKSTKVVLSIEHDEYQWVFPQESLSLLTDSGIRHDVELFLAAKSRT